MKIIIAPDSFKGCLRSSQICDLIAAGLREVLPDAELVSLPLADGGEGTVDALVNAMSGELVTVPVHDPLGRMLEASFGLIGGGETAVIEMASASGLELLEESELNPLKATTYGTGELLLAAIDHGVSEIILGIGGSATVDGGIGMAQALGYEFFDYCGNKLEAGCGGGDLCEIREIRSSGVDRRLSGVRIRVACDVTNPLLGVDGAAKVYGPQKGADPEMVEVLESGLEHLAEIWRHSGMLAHADHPGAGAAGGLGAGLKAFCHAEMLNGAELVSDVLDLERHLADADYLITGEGRTDFQTGHGKLCSVLAGISRGSGVPVILLSGAVELSRELFDSYDAVFSTAFGPGTLAEALSSAEENLRFSARSIGCLLSGREL